MRYVTEAEKKREQERLQDRAERLRWMTLVEAVQTYKDWQHCGDREAVEDLLCLTVDGKMRALSGDISYEDHTISGYYRLSKSDLQRKVKVYLNGPGFIDLTPSKITEEFEYPEVTIVAGRMGTIVFDKSDPFIPPLFPEIDELEYGPVLISREDLEKWWSAQQQEPREAGGSSSQVTGSPLPKRRHGRPRGSGSFSPADAPLIAEMHELIAEGKAKSPNDAASHVVSKAQGAGTPESKIRRLRQRYRARYSAERK